MVVRVKCEGEWNSIYLLFSFWDICSPFICEKLSGPKRSIKITESFYLYLNQCHLLYNLHSLQKVMHRQNRETIRRQIPRTPSRRRERRQNASKPVARHFNLPNHSKQHMVVCSLSLHQGSTESRRTLV